MQQPDQYVEHPDLSKSYHSSRTFTGYLSIGEPYTRLLHYVILHYLALVLNTYLTLLMFIAGSLCSSSDTHILSTPNVKVKSYGQCSLPTMVLLDGILLPLALRHQTNLMASIDL